MNNMAIDDLAMQEAICSHDILYFSLNIPLSPLEVLTMILFGEI